MTEGINESVRIFLASKIDQYVVNEKISGIVNDFGAGVPSRFTPINAKSDHKEFVIGVKQIYQGAWNPIMGFTDSYSRHIWGIISDPATFKHPFTGETIPVRTTWEVETASPNGKLDIPQEAITWNPILQKWKNVEDDSQAISKVTLDYKFSNWHNGEKMDMNDILQSLYFTIEWGTQTDAKDKTFDTEFTPRAAQNIQTIKGIRILDENTIEVYVDFWHFDKGEIADWAVLWSATPWEITAAMEKAVIEGKASFSRSGATSKNVNWLSLIIPKDANTVKDYLQEFKDTNYIPTSLKINSQKIKYYQNRYDSSISWIERNNHAVISNGPFYLESYSPESRTIKVSTFEDDSYPFKKGEWSKFENTDFPKIERIKMEKVVQRGEKINLKVETKNSDKILYFLTNSHGEKISSEELPIEDNDTIIKITSKESNNLSTGANSIKVFAISNSVLKPDFYESIFLVTENSAELPINSQKNIEFSKNESQYWVLLIPIIIIVGIIIYLKKRN